MFDIYFLLSFPGYLTQPPRNCLTEGCVVGECVRQGYDYVCKQGKCLEQLRLYTSTIHSYTIVSFLKAFLVGLSMNTK